MLRKRNISMKILKEFDAFPKIPEDYKKTSAVGGTFSLVGFCLIIYLIYAETAYFLNGHLQFQFEPDIGYNDNLQLNIDMTVAMPCNHIEADVYDSTKQNLMADNQLTKANTWWDLTPDQRAHFEALKHMNSYLREEYHALHELLWRSNQLAFFNAMPKRTYTPSYPPNACRIYGTMIIHKIAGNFHLTAGKGIFLPEGHIHASLLSVREYNFTHRIHKFSFGKPSPGIIHPLEGDEKVTSDNMMLYQYFIDIVPTDINMLLRKSTTYQYSVKDYERSVNNVKESTKLYGIFFKYDISALRIKVTQDRDSIGQFLVKLCATIGCIFVTNGLLNIFVQNCWYIFCCKFLQNNSEEN